MKSFNEYLNNVPLVQEDLHPEVQAAIHKDEPAQNKLLNVTKAVRKVIKSGASSGLSDTTPMKGSSRAVFLPRDPHPVKIDGQDTHMHTAIKIAFPGTLDKHNKSGKLLGEHQNLVEADPFTTHHFSILTPKNPHSTNHTEFETNHESGVLPPMLGSHPEGHHLHVGQVSKLSAGDFRHLTKTKEFPKGISHSEFHDAIQEHYYAAHGKRHYGTTDRDRMEQVQSHPLVEKFHRFISDTGSHPGDYRMANMGKWKHPVTGEHHIVASDYGFSTDVAKHYHDARQNMFKANAAKNRW